MLYFIVTEMGVQEIKWFAREDNFHSGLSIGKGGHLSRQRNFKCQSIIPCDMSVKSAHVHFTAIFSQTQVSLYKYISCIFNTTK